MTPEPPSTRGGSSDDPVESWDPQKRTILIGLLLVVLVAVGAFALATLWPDSTPDSVSSSLPTVPEVASDACTSAGFQSLLLGSITDDVAPDGEPRCEGAYGVLPLKRTAPAGNESLIAGFKVGEDGSWEHFATVKVEDCTALPDVESGFPESLCTK